MTNTEKEMSPIELEALTNTIRGMSEEQLRIVAQNIPVKIMCEEIANKYTTLTDKINGIMSVMNSVN